MAVTAVAGQTLSQEEFDALVTQHGGQPSGQTPAIQGRTPAQAQTAAAAGDTDPLAQQRPVYRYVLADGSYIDVRDSADGQRSEVVEYKPSASYTRSATKQEAAAPENQTPAQQNEAALNAQRAKNAAWPADQDPRYETDQERAARADARIKEQGAAAEKNKPQPGKPYQNAQGQWVMPVTDAAGNVTTRPLPADAIPQTPTEDVSAPPTQQWVVRRKGDSYETVLNPNWVRPSTVKWDERTGRWINLTVDDNGKPVVLPVDDKTAIKPADLPVLQARFGEISQALAALAQDLNAKFSRGDITAQERADAWKAAHGQADTQVAELNSILENSRAIWTQQVTQRGQTLGETQSRRSFASDAAGRAIAEGGKVAAGALPGHGKEIVAGVEALMNMQQRYAQGMGGFRESPEIGLPPALEQARGIGLPGYPMPGGGPPGVPQAAPQMSGSGPPGVPPPGQPNAIGVGAIGALPAPGAPPPGLPEPLLRPPPPVPGQSPLEGMGAALGAAEGYAGSPVAAGGPGMWDPTQTMAGMLGQGGDAAWEEAVRRAAGGFGRYSG